MRSFIKKHLGDYAYPIVVAFVALVVVGIIAVFVYRKIGKVEAQRTAKIIEVNGPCTVLREGAILNAVADMPLYSGDTFYSGINASARIMIDDDKFIYLDPTTRINFTASGTPDETHTLIFVETGSMLTEVKEKLVDGESFDIVTPNSFMEIHGTKTLTQVVADAQGNITTSSAVLEGNVRYVTVVLHDGKILCVDDNMAAGQSLGVETAGGSLLSAEELMQIVSTGQSSDGTLLLHASYEEVDVTLSEGDFDPGLLDRVTVVILKSQQDDVAAGGNVKDTDGDGVSDTINNVDALRRSGLTSGASDAGDEGYQEVVGETEDERLAREAKEAAEKEAAEREKAEQEAAAAEEAAREAAAQEAARQQADEERTQQILAIQAAEAEVAAYNQAMAEAQAEAERQAAATAQQNQGQQQGGSNNSSSSSSSSSSSDSHGTDPSTTDPSDPSTTDPSDPGSGTLQEGDEAPFGGGTFTGLYSEDGYPLYIATDEVSGESYYYYIEEPNEEGVVRYDGTPVSDPPSDP